MSFGFEVDAEVMPTKTIYIVGQFQLRTDRSAKRRGNAKVKKKKKKEEKKNRETRITLALSLSFSLSFTLFGYGI